MSVKVIIAPFERQQQREVLDLILEIQRNEFGIDISADDQPDLTEIPEFYQVGLGGFWVAKSNEAVVGTIGLKDIGNRQGALRKMFVAQAFRGKEHGVAGLLLGKLIAEAAKNGVLDVFLGTTERFLAAHRFYEKNGFAEIARHALPPAFPVMAVDSKFYKLDLAQD